MNQATCPAFLMAADDSIIDVGYVEVTSDGWEMTVTGVIPFRSETPQTATRVVVETPAGCREIRFDTPFTLTNGDQLLTSFAPSSGDDGTIAWQKCRRPSSVAADAQEHKRRTRWAKVR